MTNKFLKHARRSRRTPSVELSISKSEILEFWKDRISETGLFIDWGEPGCWACGFHYGVKYDTRSGDAPWTEILKLWERIPLQRCHIVPRALGGSDNPENLFLMCRECHDSQPNTSVPEIFFRWARNQSSSRREELRILEAFRSLGVDDDDEKFRIAECMDSEDFRKWSRDRKSIHWPQSGYAPRTHRLTPATMIGLAKFFLDSAQNR
jgi:hypothetical protein